MRIIIKDGDCLRTTVETEDASKFSSPVVVGMRIGYLARTLNSVGRMESSFFKKCVYLGN